MFSYTDFYNAKYKTKTTIPLINQKQLENVEYFNYLGSMLTKCEH